MVTKEAYQGSVEYQDEVIPYSVQNIVNGDGSETRSLTLVRQPLRPTALLELMKSIAPMPQFSEVNDVKGDMGILIGNDFDPGLQRRHKGAFGEHWKVMQAQGQAIYDALPFRYIQPYLGFTYGDYRIEIVIKSITNSEVRSRLLREVRAGLVVTLPFEVAEGGSISAPETPLVTVPDEHGEETFIKAARLKVENAYVVSEDYGLSADGLGKVVFDNAGHRIPVWETHHIPNLGITPDITWIRHPDGMLTYQHKSIYELDSQYDGATWRDVRSSVIGCAALASLSPEVTSTWRMREGYSKNATNTQRMGALQATLLSVRDANESLKGSFVRHIEDNLVA